MTIWSLKRTNYLVKSGRDGRQIEATGGQQGPHGQFHPDLVTGGFARGLETDRGGHGRAELRALIARRRRVYDLMRQLDIIEVTFLGMPTPRLRGAAGQAIAPVGSECVRRRV